MVSDHYSKKANKFSDVFCHHRKNSELTKPVSFQHLSVKEHFLIVSALVLGLLLAIALGSLRTALVAACALLCIFYPALLTLVVPALAGAIYYHCFYRSNKNGSD
jgi:hypothetical protein